MHQAGVVEEATSEWVSPVVIAHSSGKYRFCIDYRYVNSQTKVADFPLPKIREIYDALSGNKVFSVVDAKYMFWQIPLAKESRHITAFSEGRKTYQWKVVPLGLKNAPSACMQALTMVLDEQLWDHALVYIDDVIIYSKTLEEHHVHLKEVLDRLRAFNVRISISKSHFYQSELKYLGAIITPEGIRPNPALVDTILKMDIPRNARETRRFHQTANFYREFVPNFAEHARPMTRMMAKNSKVPFVWKDTGFGDPQKGFDVIKAALASHPIIALPDLTRKFTLYTDASDYAIGAVLTQLSDDEKEHVIGYFSRSLNKAELNYSVSEKEALAVHVFVRKLHHYLAAGGPHLIVTDHRAVLNMSKGPLKNPRMIRWAHALSNYPIEIIGIKGEDNFLADLQTREPVVRLDPALKEQASLESPLEGKTKIIRFNEEKKEYELIRTDDFSNESEFIMTIIEKNQIEFYQYENAPEGDTETFVFVHRWPKDSLSREFLHDFISNVTSCK